MSENPDKSDEDEEQTIPRDSQSSDSDSDSVAKSGESGNEHDLDEQGSGERRSQLDKRKSTRSASGSLSHSGSSRSTSSKTPRSSGRNRSSSQSRKSSRSSSRKKSQHGSKPRKARSAKPQRETPQVFTWLGRITLLLLILIAPWWLGAVHKPAQLALCILALVGLGIWWIELAYVRAAKYSIPILALVIGAGMLFGVAQMIPLPGVVAKVAAPTQGKVLQKLASTVEGELPENISTNFVNKKPKTTISLNPEGSQHYVNLLFLALICFLLGSHYFSTRNSVSWLAAVLTLQGSALAIFSIYQRLNFNGKIYWLIERTGGKPFGPFINRNNAGGYLLLCLAGSLGLAYLAFTKPPKDQRPRLLIGTDYPVLKRMQLHVLLFTRELTAAKIFAALSSMLIFTAILVSLSRGATVALIVASMATMWLVGIAKFPKAALIFSVATIGFVTLFVSWFGYGERISQRFESFNDTGELAVEGRFKLWRNAIEIIPDYPVFGCGMNAFKDVFRGYRHTVETAYFEYAENAYLQTQIETGVFGTLLLILAIMIVAYSVYRLLTRGNSRKTIAVATIGTFALSGQMASALFDFSLYIPAVTVLMALIGGFIAGQAQSLAERSKKKWFLTLRSPSWFVHALILVLFSGGVIVCLNLFAQHRVNVATGKSPLEMDYEELSLKKCDERIELLESRISLAPDARAYKRLAELYFQKIRLEILERQKLQSGLDENASMDDEQRQRRLDSMWALSDWMVMHRQLSDARLANDQRQVRLLLSDPIVSAYMPLVRINLLRARKRMPLDPGTQLMLAQFQTFSEHPEVASVHLERANAITPKNAGVAFTAGILYLQAGNDELAMQQLRKALELKPQKFHEMIEFSLSSGLKKENIARRMLLNSDSIAGARMLYHFAETYLSEKPEQSLKKEVLDRADDVLSEVADQDKATLALHAEVKKMLGLTDEAIRIKLKVLHLDPLSQKIHQELLDLYEMANRWEEAKEECGWLIRNSNRPGFYKKRLTDINGKSG